MTHVALAEHRTLARWTIDGVEHAVATDAEIPGKTWHVPALARDVELEESWVEDVSRGASVQLAVVRLSSEEVALLDEFDDALLDEAGEPLLTESPAYASLTVAACEGLAVTVQTLTRVFYVDGSSQTFSRTATLTCVGRSWTPGGVTLTLRDVEDEKLNALYPPRVYVASDWLALREEDAGRAVPRVFGTALKLQGALVTKSAPWRYVLADLTDLADGDPSSVLTIYRGRSASDARVVDPSEYTVGTGTLPWRHLWVEFAREQRDFNGAPYLIFADIQSVLPDVNAALPLQKVLESAGVALDGSSVVALTTWANDSGRLVSCDFGRVGQRAVRAIAEDLLAVLCATVYRTPTGLYAFRPDGPGSVLASYDEDAGDAIEVLGVEDSARPSSVAIAFRPSPQDANRLQLVQTRSVSGGTLGAERPRQLGYVRTGNAADRVTLHRARRAELSQRLRVRVYRAQHEVGDVLGFSSVAWGMTPSAWRVRRSTSIVGGCELECTPYSDALWTYVAGAIPADATAEYSPDFSATPPNAPSSLRITALGTSLQSDGPLVARVTADAVPPAVNWQALWLAAVHNTTGEITLTRAEDVGGGRFGATLTGLRPGEVYQLLCYAVNAFGLKGQVQATFNATAVGGGSAVTTFTTAGFAAVPPNISSAQAFQIPPRAIEVRWTDVAIANLREYIVERNVNSAGWAEMWRGRALRAIDRDVDYGNSYQYRVRARDTWGNFSGYTSTTAISLVSGSLFGGSSGNDIAISTVSTSNRTAVSTISGTTGSVGFFGSTAYTIAHGLGRVPVIGQVLGINTTLPQPTGAAVDASADSSDITFYVYGIPRATSSVNAANPHSHDLVFPSGTYVVAADVW